jgi:ribonuclease III
MPTSISLLNEKIHNFTARGEEPLPVSVIEDLFPSVGFLNEEKKKKLESILQVEIHHTSIFEQALTHRSYLQVLFSPQAQQPIVKAYSNERLEFLGDAILSYITAEFLFYMRADILEGELTKMRSWLVNKKSLAYCARQLRLHECMMLSASARQSLQSGNDSMLADVLEAIIAAIYLDSGRTAATNFVVSIVLGKLFQEATLVSDSNYKSILLEYAQANGLGNPRYHTVHESGPDHVKEFVVQVLVEEKIVGTGQGRSKKDAEQIAAKAALELFKVALPTENE